MNDKAIIIIGKLVHNTSCSHKAVTNHTTDGRRLSNEIITLERIRICLCTRTEEGTNSVGLPPSASWTGATMRNKVNWSWASTGRDGRDGTDQREEPCGRVVTPTLVWNTQRATIIIKTSQPTQNYTTPLNTTALSSSNLTFISARLRLSQR